MKTKITFLLVGLLLAFQTATAATATFNVTVPNDGGSDNHTAKTRPTVFAHTRSKGFGEIKIDIYRTWQYLVLEN